MYRFFSGLCDRIFAIIGAIIFLQFPMFMHDYTQQLSGHVSELKYQAEILYRAAESTGKTLPEFIQKFRESTDLDYALGGQIMQEMVQRYQNLLASYNSLEQSTIFTKPIVFFKNLDWDIAKSTYEHYQFALSLSLEGIVYALIGIYIGVVAFYIISKFLNFACRPLFKKKV